MISLLFLFWIAFNRWGIFYFFPNLDIPFHFLGGYISALGVFGIFKNRILKVKDTFIFFGFILGSVALIGIGWEIFEWVLDNLILHKPNFLQASTGDMLSDLLMDILGALVFSLLKIKSKP